MATRLNYIVPIASQLARAARRRLQPGGLAASLPVGGKQLVIVTGAGRSGTSAVARVLHESGVRMGDNLAAPSDANADGFYEELPVVLLHERMLTELGMSGMWQSQRWAWRSTVLAIAQRHRAEMAALLRQAGGDGWKDPRFSLTLEAWLPLLPSKPKVIVCLRSPEAYAESVQRVFGLVELEAARRQWARHYRRLLDVIRDYRLEALCVEYDTLVERPEETVAALGAFVGRPLRAEFVNPPLRRHVQPVPQRYRGLYQRVWSLSRVKGESERSASLRSPDAHDEPRVPTKGYAERAEAIRARTRAAKDTWERRVRMPRPALDDDTRAACEGYRSDVCEAQRELAGLEPPPELERQHALAVEQVNLQRVIVELTFAAISGDALDRRTLRAAVGAWRRFGQPEAFS